VSQQPVELILMRQLASSLAMPIFIVDVDGNLVFYNEPAEPILGRRFEESGAMPVDELSTIFRVLDDSGNVIPPETLPIAYALSQQRPAHRRILIQGLDGQRRRIAVTAFPLEGQSGRHLGAVAIFWEDGAGLDDL
jgi:PAS domain-containing protein